MKRVFRTVTVQVADHLRSQRLEGRWQSELPGHNQLASELGVNRKTVEPALRLVKTTGLNANPGKGRRRPR